MLRYFCNTMYTRGLYIFLFCFIPGCFCKMQTLKLIFDAKVKFLVKNTLYFDIICLPPGYMLNTTAAGTAFQYVFCNEISTSPLGLFCQRLILIIGVRVNFYFVPTGL